MNWGWGGDSNITFNQQQPPITTIISLAFELLLTPEDSIKNVTDKTIPEVAEIDYA